MKTLLFVMSQNNIVVDVSQFCSC